MKKMDARCMIYRVIFAIIALLEKKSVDYQFEDLVNKSYIREANNQPLHVFGMSKARGMKHQPCVTLCKKEVEEEKNEGRKENRKTEKDEDEENVCSRSLKY